jgi:hypothetical protein
VALKRSRRLHDNQDMGLRLIAWALRRSWPFHVWMQRHPWLASMLFASPVVALMGLTGGLPGEAAGLLMVPVLRAVLWLASKA